MSQNNVSWSFRGNEYIFPFEKLPLESVPGREDINIYPVAITELQLVAKSDKSYEDAAEKLDGPIFGLMIYLESAGRMLEVDRFINGSKKPYYAPNREFLGDGAFEGNDADKKYKFPVKVFKDFDFFLAELPELKIKGYSRVSAQEAFDFLKQTVIMIFQRPDLYDKENVRETFLVREESVPEIVIDNNIPEVETPPQGEVGNLE